MSANERYDGGSAPGRSSYRSLSLLGGEMLVMIETIAMGGEIITATVAAVLFSAARMLHVVVVVVLMCWCGALPGGLAVTDPSTATSPVGQGGTSGGTAASASNRRDEDTTERKTKQIHRKDHDAVIDEDEIVHFAQSEPYRYPVQDVVGPKIWEDAGLFQPIFMRDVHPVAPGRLNDPRDAARDISKIIKGEGADALDIANYEVPDYHHTKMKWHEPAAGQPPIFPFISIGGGGAGNGAHAATSVAADHRAVREALPPPEFKLSPLPPLEKHHPHDMDVAFEEPPLDDVFNTATDSGGGAHSYARPGALIDGLDQPGCVRTCMPWARCLCWASAFDRVCWSTVRVHVCVRSTGTMRLFACLHEVTAHSPLTHTHTHTHRTRTRRHIYTHTHQVGLTEACSETSQSGSAATASTRCVMRAQPSGTPSPAASALGVAAFPTLCTMLVSVSYTHLTLSTIYSV